MSGPQAQLTTEPCAFSNASRHLSCPVYIENIGVHELLIFVMDNDGIP